VEQSPQLSGSLQDCWPLAGLPHTDPLFHATPLPHTTALPHAAPASARDTEIFLAQVGTETALEQAAQGGGGVPIPGGV